MPPWEEGVLMRTRQVFMAAEMCIRDRTGSDRTKLRVKKWAVQEVEKLADPIDNTDPKEKEKK